MGDFAVKLARVCRPWCFQLKVWCQFHLHSSYQSFDRNCTTFTQGLFYLFSFKACLNKLLFVFFVCIFRCHDQSRINSSDMQYRRLSVWSVYFNSNTLSCQNYFFPEGVGGVHKTCGNSGGVGGLLLCSKNGNSGEKGGLA